MRISYIADALSLILKDIGIVTLVPIFVALYYHEFFEILPYLLAAGLALFVSKILKIIANRTTKPNGLNDIKRSEALFIVSSCWVLFSLIASIPYMFEGFGIMDSLFESISGITATGATIFTSFDCSKSLLFWRSFTQWLGGMGIIVLFVAILPQFAVAGRQMFFAEAPGPTEDKFTPRIKNTASTLWILYALLTFICMLALYFAGMNLFDAVCNAFSTLSAGGFSPHARSIGGYNSNIINWIIIVFMFISGASFVLQSRVFSKKKPSLFWRSEEFRIYTYLVLGLSGVLALLLVVQQHYDIWHSITASIYQVLALATSTGSASEDFELWSNDCKIILFIAMFMSSCAGSTGGGMKLTRWMLVFKYMKNEIYKILHPKTVMSVKIDNKVVPFDTVKQIIFYVFCYFVIWGFSALIFASQEQDLALGLSVSISALGDIGPGIGDGVGPYGTYAFLTDFSKFVFMIDMLIGRLEIIPFLVLVHPDFWTVKKA